jgi:hypothetical protein
MVSGCYRSPDSSFKIPFPFFRVYGFFSPFFIIPFVVLHFKLPVKNFAVVKNENPILCPFLEIIKCIGSTVSPRNKKCQRFESLDSYHH